MTKLSFEEYLKAREEYMRYIGDDPEKVTASSAAGSDQTPAPAKQQDPEKDPEPAPAMGPAEDYRAELNEIREQMKKMAAALSPSLGDVEPVGIEDVVTNFFKQS